MIINEKQSTATLETAVPFGRRFIEHSIIKIGDSLILSDLKDDSIKQRISQQEEYQANIERQENDPRYGK